MITCPECGQKLPEETKYCVFCGTNVNLSKFIKQDRFVFFLTPIFIFIICIAFAFEEQSQTPVETGIYFGSIATVAYFGGALFLGMLKILFKAWTSPVSFFVNGIATTFIVIFSNLAIFDIENHFMLDFLNKSGPTILEENRLILFFALSISISIIETLAVSAWVRITLRPDSVKNKPRAFIFRISHIAIPVFYGLLVIIGAFMVDKPQFDVALSEFYYSLNSVEKAQNVINQGLELYPESAILCYQKARSLARSEVTTENSEEILKYALKATELNKESPLYFHFLSLAYDMNMKSDLAIESAGKSVELAPNDVFLIDTHATLCMKYSRFKECIESYKKILTINPDNAKVLNNLAFVLLENDKDLPIALELAKQSVKLEPSTISNRDTLAWAYYKNQDLNNAIETMNIIYDGRTEISPEVDFHYAVILNELGLLKNPLETFDKMLVKPELLTNGRLLLQIAQERTKTEKALKEQLSKETKESND